jgi:mycobactin peptide synthetase MbtE
MRDAPAPDLAEASAESCLESVLDVMRRTLDKPFLTPGTPLFETGATSMDAARVCAALSGKIGITMPLSQFFQEPTAAAAAAWFDAWRDSSVKSAELDDQPKKGTPLLPTQVGFLFDRAAGFDSAGHYEMVWWVTGALDDNALRDAVGDVHRRHEALRASYVVDEQPVAVVDDTSEPELSYLPGAADDELVGARLDEALRAPLRIEDGKVWRVVVVRVTGTDRTLLGCTVHHVAFDGHSASILLHDLAVAYSARRANREPRFDGPAASLAQIHAGYERQRARADVVRQEKYWARTLAGIPSLALPAAAPDSPATVVHVEVPVADATELDRVARRAGTSRFAGLVTVYAKALCHVTGQEDFGIGVPVAHRGDAVLATAVGCLVDVVCLRMRLRQGTPLFDDISNTGELVRSAMAARDVPISVASRLAAGTNGFLPDLPYQTEFTYMDSERPRLRLPPARTTPRARKLPPAVHGLIAEAESRPDGAITVHLCCSADDAVVQFVHQLKDAFSHVLTELPTGT